MTIYLNNDSAGAVQRGLQSYTDQFHFLRPKIRPECILFKTGNYSDRSNKSTESYKLTG